MKALAADAILARALVLAALAETAHNFAHIFAGAPHAADDVVLPLVAAELGVAVTVAVAPSEEIPAVAVPAVGPVSFASAVAAPAVAVPAVAVPAVAAAAVVVPAVVVAAV
eukprot:SAG31_NODE_7397_length_1700_cov_2.505934_1_plen_110_part_10